MNRLHSTTPTHIATVIKDSEAMREYRAVKAKWDRVTLVVAAILLIGLFVL